MQSALFKLNGMDFARAALNAVFVGVIFAVGGAVTQTGFDLFTVDWIAIAHLAVNSGFVAFISFLVHRFSSDESGKVLGGI